MTPDFFTISSCLASLLVARAYFRCFFTSRRLPPASSALIWAGALSVCLFLPGLPERQSFFSVSVRPLALSFACFLLHEGNFLKMLALAFFGNTVSALVKALIFFTLSSLSPPAAVSRLAFCFLPVLVLLLLVMIAAQKVRFCPLPPLDFSVWFPLFSIPAASGVLLFLLLSDPNAPPHSSCLAACLLLLINLCAFLAYGRLSLYARSEQELAGRARQLSAAVSQIQAQETPSLELQKKLHDFKNTLLYLQRLADDADCAALSDYVSQCLGPCAPSSQAAATGNPVLDSLVNCKCGAARSLGISFTAHLEIPSGLPLDGESLCIVLGNALDNAIEAASDFHGFKYVELSIRYQKGCLCILVKNRGE